nr:cytochrome P450 [Paris polyphylla]
MTTIFTSQLFFTSLALALLLLILLLFNSNKLKGNGTSKRLKLPPGPPGWPVIGNLFQFFRSGKQFIHYTRDLRAIYGPIFTLRMGSRTLIVVSSAELAHEALITKGQLFASRPAENPTRTIFSCDKFTVNSAVYGPEWRSLRRNMVSGMLSASRIREYRCHRQSAMDLFISRIRAEADAAEGAVYVLKNARFAVFCILLSMTFGLELDEEVIEQIDQLMKKVLINLIPRIDDYLPLLAPFFSKQRKETLEIRKEQMETLVPLIEQRQSLLQNPKPNTAPFSYLDSLFDLKVEGRKSAPTPAELVTLCSEFINGGTDTTATAIEWGMARLIENLDMQSRIYEEIVGVVGDERAVDEADTEKMVYLQAFVKELLRKHPPTYFSLTHAAIQPAKLGGYDIPTDANLDIFLPTISEDPKLWIDPARFNPDRFLGGGETADMTGVTGIKMIPFGAGRRICPGLGMAMTHITLMMARMVQAFEWRAHPSQTVLDFDDKLEFTVVMRRPLLAVVRPRK